MVSYGCPHQLRWTGGRARRCSGNGDERHLVLVLRHGGEEGARHSGGDEELVQAIWGRSVGYSRGRRCCSTLPHKRVLLGLFLAPAAPAEFWVIPQSRASPSRPPLLPPPPSRSSRSPSTSGSFPSRFCRVVRGWSRDEL